MGKLKNNFPRLFKEYKKKVGKTQAQIAVAWGLDPATLSRYINEHTDGIKYEFLETVCNGMGVKPSDVLEWQEEPEQIPE